jgi:hypothetical protein
LKRNFFSFNDSNSQNIRRRRRRRVPQASTKKCEAIHQKRALKDVKKEKKNRKNLEPKRLKESVGCSICSFLMGRKERERG